MNTIHRFRPWILILILIILVGSYWGINYINETYSYETISIEEVIPGYASGNIAVVIEDQPVALGHVPILKDEQIYLPVDMVNQYINPYYYWEEETGILIITTEHKVIRMETDELTYFVNEKPLSLQIPIIQVKDMAYIPVDIIQWFDDVKVKYLSEQQILTLDYGDTQRKIGTVEGKRSFLYYQADEESPVIEEMDEETELFIYRDLADWYKVRTASGLVGYIEKKSLANIHEEEKEQNVEEEQEQIDSSIEGNVTLVWDQVQKGTSYPRIKEKLKDSTGINVLAPTWFSIINENGDIQNIADHQYVEWAHEEGYQVWALLDNQFNSSLTHEVLKDSAKRQYLVKQILAYSAVYDLDGINIDFESVASGDGEYLTQFIRELSPMLQEQEMTLSIDCYVPSSWTAHYNRAELGKAVDYFIIMAYDEHWGSSPESGSVASMGFVQRGIEKTLEDVPKEKILLGVPFYTRLWMEENTDEGTDVSSEAYSMEGALEILKEKGVDPVWNEETGQYYGEYTQGDTTYKIWLEEENSMEERMKLLQKYDLAGVAGWKLGLEKKDIWELILSYNDGD